MDIITPGIYRLKLPLRDFVTSHVNVYLVKGKECLIVDTGWDNQESLEYLRRQLEEVGLVPEDIKHVVVTHGHTDHMSMAHRIQSQFHARLYMHKRDVEVVNSRSASGQDFIQQTDELLRRNGVPDSELHGPYPALPEIAFVNADVMLEGGETITLGNFNLKVLWTPGHSPGHICLYEPAHKLLFSGDLVMPTIAPNVGLHLQYSSNPLGDYLSSLDMVKKLDVELVLPAHEHPFRNLRERADEIFQRHRQRDNEIISIMSDGKPRNAYQLAVTMTWLPDTASEGWKNLDPWNKRLAVLETLAHLEFLRSGDKLDKSVSNGAVIYRAC